MVSCKRTPSIPAIVGAAMIAVACQGTGPGKPASRPTPTAAPDLAQASAPRVDWQRARFLDAIPADSPLVWVGLRSRSPEYHGELARVLAPLYEHVVASLAEGSPAPWRAFLARELADLPAERAASQLGISHGDGELLRREIYATGGVKHGVWRWWWPNGTELKRLPYVAGKLHGPSLHWHSDGSTWMEGHYVDGQPHGWFRSWDRTGKLVGRHRLVRGNGEMAFYHANRQVYERGPLRRGLRHGEWKMWDESPTLIETQHWKDGERQYDEAP